MMPAATPAATLPPRRQWLPQVCIDEALTPAIRASAISAFISFFIMGHVPISKIVRADNVAQSAKFMPPEKTMAHEWGVKADST